ncbi:MAG TPA: hypothetical protein VN939_11820 [Chthoniobacterales bacterium]|jgi:YVTN family beta-propeller protein|nr:hypothetical protein [Chthoniobacterales bacterium]
MSDLPNPSNLVSLVDTRTTAVKAAVPVGVNPLDAASF